MPIKELEDLLATITDPADRATMETIFERNPDTRQQAIEQRNLYRAFVDGDTQAITDIEQQQREATARAMAAARQTTGTGTSTGSSVGLTLDQILAETTKLMDTRFKPELEKQSTYIEEVATRAAQKIADQLGPRLLAESIGTADTVYSIRSSHQAEFGEPLDMTKFNEFVDANKGSYSSLTAAHDAYVQQKRIDKRIAEGVAEGIAAHETTDVPGTTVAGANSMLSRFVSKNSAMGGAARGEGLDAATKAFRDLRSKHAS